MSRIVISALLLACGLAAPQEGFVGLVLKVDPHNRGVVVVQGLASGASAQKVGVKEGDIILAFKGLEVSGIQEFIAAAKATPPGQNASLKIRRGKEEIVFEIPIVSRDEFVGTGMEALKGKKVPSFTAVNILTHKTIEFSKLEGQPIILELWATWCPACVSNIPKLNEVAQKLKGRVRVMALSFEKDEVVRKFFEKRKPAFDLVALEPSSMNVALMSNGSIPKFIIIDAKGTVVEITTSAAAAERVLTTLK